jgi:antitoxin HigA-1
MTQPLPTLRPRRVIRALEKAGFALLRVKSTASSTCSDAHQNAPLALPHPPGRPPGEVLADGLKLPVAAAARQLGVSPNDAASPPARRAGHNPEMALYLGRLCGNGPEVWLRMQMAHDLRRAERTLRADLARTPTHRA